MKLSPLFLAILLLSSSVFADTWPRQDGVNAQNYIFHLTLREDSDEFTGQSTDEILFTKDGLTSFFLDLATPTTNRGGAAVGMTVTAVTLAGKPVQYSHTDNKLTITLPEPTKAGQKLAFDVQYHGVPASGVHIGLNKYKERSIFSENWPDRAHQWLPCIDHPHDKATSEMFVTAPSKYQIISNGLLIGEIDNGDGTRMTHWKNSVPIATWLNAIGVAQFSVHYAGNVRGIPLQTWVYHQDADALTAPIEDVATKAIEFYSDYVGPFAYEKLANVQAYGIGGGTEHASAIFYGENSLNPRGLSSLVAHEIAHQWFGNCVTERDWDDVWLSEGFATYFALLYAEKYQGHDAFIAGFKRSRDTVLRANPQIAVIHDNVSDGRRILNNMVYQKGSCTLHMLRGLIGDTNFQAGLRQYFQKFHNANASTDDLRTVMEGVSKMKLDWFFDQWLKRAGEPNLKGTWHYDAAAKQVLIDLTQAQDGDPYRLPLEIGLGLKEVQTPVVNKVEMTERHQTFKIPAESEPIDVQLDPNTWLLMQSSLSKQP